MDTLEDTHHYFSHMNTVVSSRITFLTVCRPEVAFGNDREAIIPRGGDGGGRPKVVRQSPRFGESSSSTSQGAVLGTSLAERLAERLGSLSHGTTSALLKER